jgi:hypothetical protein
MKIDGDSLVRIKTTSGFFDPVEFNNVLDILIEGPNHQPYHNQFTPSQFKTLDTIQIIQKFVSGGQTPVLLLGNHRGMDTILFGQKWFSTWLIENEGIIDSVYISVYSVNKLRKCDRKKINEVKNAYCDLVGLKPENVLLLYKTTPYVMGQQDFFNEGTIVNKKFLSSQNTDYMSKKADDYSIVMQVMMGYKQR